MDRMPRKRKTAESPPDYHKGEQINFRIPDGFEGLKDAFDAFGRRTGWGRNKALALLMAKAMRNMGYWSPPEGIDLDAMLSPLFEIPAEPPEA
jgi:hypothetical protein